MRLQFRQLSWVDETLRSWVGRGLHIVSVDVDE